MQFLSVGHAAKLLGVAPKVISDALYRGAIRDDLAPVLAGRRLIDQAAIPVLEMALRRAGKLPALAIAGRAK